MGAQKLVRRKGGGSILGLDGDGKDTVSVFGYHCFNEQSVYEFIYSCPDQSYTLYTIPTELMFFLLQKPHLYLCSVTCSFLIPFLKCFVLLFYRLPELRNKLMYVGRVDRLVDVPSCNSHLWCVRLCVRVLETHHNRDVREGQVPLDTMTTYRKAPSS